MIKLSRYLTLSFLLIPLFLLVAISSSYSFLENTKDLIPPLIFGADISYPPYSYEDKNIPQGFFIDITKKISEIVGRPITIKLMTWENCITALNNKKIDGIIGTFPTTDWVSDIRVSKPFYQVEYSIIIEADNHHVDSLKSLEGTIIGMKEKCNIIDLLSENKRLAILKYKKLPAAFKKLQNREITAVVCEKNSAFYYIEQHNFGDFKMLAPIMDLTHQCSIGIHKENLQILNAINDAIDKLKESGELNKLNTKWFGSHLIHQFSFEKVLSLTIQTTIIILLILIILWVIALNVTLKIKTNELAEMHVKIIEKEKLAVLGTMAGHIAHEIRTPLGIMKNSVYLLRIEGCENKEIFLKRLQMLDEKIKLSSNILESILNYSRIKTKVPSEISVKTCLNEVLNDLDISSGIEIEIKTTDNEPDSVFMDPLQLYSVFRNIITNGIQSMKDKGKLTIEIFSSYNNNDSKINIKIKDTGMGIDENSKEKIFDLFYSTKLSGTGLGLPMSKAILEANNGNLLLENTSPSGTSFLITLPSSSKKMN
ncbi:Extracellular solute-binding protein, family 3 [Candidatus Omnitrophus magneticus]|uniref:histidine kinase n=1 Tax=Candidatus Omnitrophus magneticus TaxID=1609969 RepID=A0A0F0CQ91_9BACT|nr:Extracellular solute-binding protein, family 3 [Candidatus Omnitrophus magneticus]